MIRAITRWLTTAGVAFVLCSNASAQWIYPPGSSLSVPSGASVDLSCMSLDMQGVLELNDGLLSMDSNAIFSSSFTVTGTGGTISVGGDLLISGSLDLGENSLELRDGCVSSTSQLAGGLVVQNLTLKSNTGRKFVLQAGSNITVLGMLTIEGVLGQPVELQSSSASATALISLGPKATVVRSNAIVPSTVQIGEVPPPPPPPPPVKLQVTTSGAGTVQRSVAGSVVGAQGSITTVEYPHSQAVTLTARPQAGARFNGWLGACFGLLTCHLTLHSDQSVQATFSTPATGGSMCLANNFSANEERVMGAYLAYYGRPADVDGLTYWAVYLAGKGGYIEAIIDAFGNSQEFQQRFGQMGGEELIANLYQQMYGRNPDANGADFYESQLATGKTSLGSIAINILDGTIGIDRLVLENRKKVVHHFVTRMEELGRSAPAFEDGDALARLLSGVQGNAESTEAGCAQIDQLLETAPQQ